VDTWSCLWIAWIATFGVLEGGALARKEPRLGDRPKVTGLVQVRLFALLAGLAWRAAHFLTGSAVLRSRPTR
jgi:hypothetical protein